MRITPDYTARMHITAQNPLWTRHQQRPFQHLVIHTVVFIYFSSTLDASPCVRSAERRRGRALIHAALADHARGSIERGLAATVSHRDLIFLNVLFAGKGDFSPLMERGK
jgi:hypothetical protein